MLKKKYTFTISILAKASVRVLALSKYNSLILILTTYFLN